MTHKITSFSIAALTIGMALLLAGCQANASHQDQAKETPVKTPNPFEIKVNSTLLQQIKIGEPKWAPVAGSLRVAGRVEADATRLARIGSPVTGRITNLVVMEGEHVKKGQVLATIHSTELSDTQFAFIKAYSQQQLSQRAADRAKQLLSADVIGTAELQRREAEVLQASAEVSALKQQLKVLGMSDQAIEELETTRKLNSEYQVIASIDGIVLERKVTIGQIVQPAEIAFMIADLSQVWLIADIPEQEAGDITVGKTVEAEIAAFPEQVIHGQLSFVSATVNPETRTVRTRLNLPNPRGKYKPAMLAMITLIDGVQREQTVPTTAIVREENRDHVFVQTNANTFVLRQVTLGDEFEDTRVVKDGIRTGEKIVLDGAFHLNNERKRLALQGGA